MNMACKNLCNEDMTKRIRGLNLSDDLHFRGFQGPCAVHFRGSAETQNQFVKQEVNTTSIEYLSVFNYMGNFERLQH